MDVVLVGGYVLHFPRTLAPPYPSQTPRRSSVSFSVLDTSGVRNAIILLVLMGAVTVISVHAERK